MKDSKYQKFSIGWYKELARESEYPEEIKDNVIGPFLKWAEQNKILINGERKYNRDRTRIWRHKTGRNLSMNENEECSSYFGIEIAENYISALFEDVKRMPYGNSGFDFICKKGYKIQSKARCLIYNGNAIYWQYDIDFNNIADYFLLSAWNNRLDLEPLYLWLIQKDEIIRDRRFWQRDNIVITNKSEYLYEFSKYELKEKLGKLKDCCNRGD